MTTSGRYRPQLSALAALLVLSGCGGSEEATPGPESSEVSSSAGSSREPGAPPTAAAEEKDRKDGLPEQGGTVAEDAADRGLPDGFPVAAVPVIEGDVVGASRGKAGAPFAYTVLLEVPQPSPVAVMASVTSRLRGAGFSSTPGTSTEKISTATFRTKAYEVGVNVIRADGVTTVTYVVAKR